MYSSYTIRNEVLNEINISLTEFIGFGVVVYSTLFVTLKKSYGFLPRSVFLVEIFIFVRDKIIYDLNLVFLKVHNETGSHPQLVTRYFVSVYILYI